MIEFEPDQAELAELAPYLEGREWDDDAVRAAHYLVEYRLFIEDLSFYLNAGRDLDAEFARTAEQIEDGRLHPGTVADACWGVWWDEGRGIGVQAAVAKGCRLARAAGEIVNWYTKTEEEKCANTAE